MTQEKKRVGGRLLTNVLAGAGSQAITAAIALWSVPAILHALGTAGYGIYSLASALVGYFSVADLGLANATLQRLGQARAANDPAAFNRTVASSIVLLAGLGAIGCVVLLLGANDIAQLLAGQTADARDRALMLDATRLCAWGAIPVLVRPVLESVFAASERLVLTYSVSTVSNIARTAGVVAALAIKADVVVAVTTLVVVAAIQAIVLLALAIWSTPQLRQAKIRFTFDEIRHLLRTSLPVWMTTSTGVLANQLDKLIVSTICGFEAAGRYAVAMDLASRLWMFPYIFGKVYFARLSYGLARGNPIEHAGDIRRYAAASLVSALVPAIPLALYAAPFLQAFLGSAVQQETSTIFTLLIAGVVANVASFSAFTVLQLKLHLRALAWPHLAYLFFHGITCFLLAKSMGPVGAALSWFLAMTLLWLALQANLQQFYRLPVIGDLMRIFAGAGIAAAALAILISVDRIALPSQDRSVVVRLFPVLWRATSAATFTLVVIVAALLVRRDADARALFVPVLRRS